MNKFEKNKKKQYFYLHFDQFINKIYLLTYAKFIGK